MARGPVVVDIDVFSAHLIVNPLLARRNEPLPAGRGEIISYQTVTELHDGVHLDGWSQRGGCDVIRNPAELFVAFRMLGCDVAGSDQAR